MFILDEIYYPVVLVASSVKKVTKDTIIFEYGRIIKSSAGVLSSFAPNFQDLPQAPAVFESPYNLITYLIHSTPKKGVLLSNYFTYVDLPLNLKVGLSRGVVEKYISDNYVKVYDIPYYLSLPFPTSSDLLIATIAGEAYVLHEYNKTYPNEVTI